MKGMLAMRMVTAELHSSGKIILGGTTFHDADKAKGVGGGRWNAPVNGCWSYPLFWETCKSLRTQFGVRLEIGPKLWKWAKAEKRKHADVAKLSSAMDADLQVIPDMFPLVDEAMSSRTYQRSGARFMAKLRSAGNLDEVGLGKTLTSLAAIAEADRWRGTHLIIASKAAVESVWADEIEHWFGDDIDNIGIFPLVGTRPQRERMLDAFFDCDSPTAFLILNKEMLRIQYEQWCTKCNEWEKQFTPEQSMEHIGDNHKTKRMVFKCDWPDLFGVEWDSVTIDEVHKVLSTGMKSRTRMSQTAAGVESLQYAKDALRFAISGTPFRGKEINLWGVLNWIDPVQFSSKWRFAETYFNVTNNGYVNTIGGLRPEKQKDFDELLGRVFLRRTRKEVRADIPSKMRTSHWVRLDGEHKRQYEEFAENGAAELESGTVEGIGVLSELTRLRQFAFGCWDIEWRKDGYRLKPTMSSPKMDLITEMLEERGVTGDPKTEFKLDGGFKYIISSQFTQVVDACEMILNSMGIDTLKITGSVTGKNRKHAVKSFQNDPDGPRVLVMNTIAGGESITLDNYCDEMFIIDETWVADDQLQLEGRIDNRRQDRLKQRTYHYIRTKGTIEEGIAALNEQQENIQRMLLDVRRGVDNAIKLIEGNNV